MNKIVKFFHELFHPHCIECVQEEEHKQVCESCETLKMQLSLANQREKELLSLLVQKNQPQSEPVTSNVELKPIMPRTVPWRVKREMLEEEDRNKARVLAQQKKLEDELNLEVNNAASRAKETAT